MESPSPEHPEPRPIDRTPVSDAQKKSLQEAVDQSREEELARRQSMPTKLLGWMLIGGFCLEVVGGFTSNHTNLGGLVFLFAGISILKGSQAWLRFVTFFVVPGSVASIVYLIGSIALGYPVEVGSKWTDYRHLPFWTLAVSPAMLMLAESFLAVLAFKLRGIAFWTRTVAIFAGIITIMLLIQIGSTTLEWHRNRLTGREIPTELQAARLLVNRYGTSSSSRSINDWNGTFEPMDKVREVNWMTSPNITMGVYDRKSRIGRSRSTYRIEHYSELLNLPSGEWGKLEFEVILPEAP